MLLYLVVISTLCGKNNVVFPFSLVHALLHYMGITDAKIWLPKTCHHAELLKIGSHMHNLDKS